MAACGPTETLRAVQALATGGETAALREIAWQCAGYLLNNRHRLDYPCARAAGYPIGSGRIESACCHVVQQRLKLAGMQWDHRHAMAVLAARCADINGDWDDTCQKARAKLAA